MMQNQTADKTAIRETRGRYRFTTSLVVELGESTYESDSRRIPVTSGEYRSFEEADSDLAAALEHFSASGGRVEKLVNGRWVFAPEQRA